MLIILTNVGNKLIQDDEIVLLHDGKDTGKCKVLCTLDGIKSILVSCDSVFATILDHYKAIPSDFSVRVDRKEKIAHE